MQLEDYFDFLGPDDIRIKGSRIGIETVLLEYLHHAKTPEEIQQTYPSRSLEEIYATIFYYLHNKKEVEAYLERCLEYCFRAEQEYEKNPPPVVLRLRQLKAQRKAKKARRSA